MRGIVFNDTPETETTCLLNGSSRRMDTLYWQAALGKAGASSAGESRSKRRWVKQEEGQID